MVRFQTRFLFDVTPMEGVDFSIVSQGFGHIRYNPTYNDGNYFTISILRVAENSPAVSV